MNLMSSKLVKSSKTQLINRSIETIQVYSCQLYIDSFKISHRGFVYFLWLSQNNQIQSLKYESTGKFTQVKQTLTIGVRVTSKNGKQLPLNTNLKLMTEQGEELDQFQLTINTLTAQFKQMEVPMDRGLCVLRARRRPMNITEEEQLSFKGLYRSRNTKYEQKRQSAGDYQVLQQQLLKIKKQLQDEVYLNNKLKNDRDVLIANKQQLELEIENLLLQVTKEISVLRGHYDNRITIREHCYEEEIENLVNVFNSQNEQNKKVIEVILKQKHRIEEEIRPLNEKNKKLEAEINQKNDIISQLQKHVLETQRLIKERNETLDELNFTIQSLGREKQLQQNEVRQLRLEITSLHGQLEGNKLTFLNYDSKIRELQRKISEYDLLLKSKDEKIKDLQNEIMASRQREQSSSKQKEMIIKQKGYIQEQNHRLLQQIQVLKAKLEEYQYEMQFNQNVMGQLKKQQQQKENELYYQIENIEQMYAKKIDEIIASFKNQKDNILTTSQLLQREKEELEGRLKELSNIAEQSESKMSALTNEINNLQNEMKNNKDNVEAKDRMIELLQKQVEKLKSEVQKNHMIGSGHKTEKSNKHNQMNMVDELNKKIQELQATIANLQSELNKSKLELENKDKRIKQVQGELQKKSQMSLKKTKSIKEGEDKEKNRVNQEQIYNLIGEKETEINNLKRKLNELQNLYEYLQLRINLILNKYPQVDMAQINQQLGEVERCESEQEEEKVINQNMGILGSLKEVPQQNQENTKILNQTSKKIRISIGHQNQQPQERNVYRSTKLKKQISINSYKDARSQYGTSYVKVSHSKKIKDLQQRIHYLQKKEEAYLKQIETYNQQLGRLKNEVNELTSLKKQKHDENQVLISSPSFRSPLVEVKKVSTESQVFLEDEKMKSIIIQNQNKQIETQKKNLRIGQLQDEIKQISKLKHDSEQQSRMLEVKINDYMRRQDQNNKKFESLNELIKHLQKQVAQLEEKLRKEKQISQETRISVKQINIHFENAQAELKKVKNLNQTLQDKVKKLSGSDLVIRDLNKEIEDLGKKALEMTRTINHIKLEKDAHQEELRMLKKRQSDQTRIASEWEQKAASLERQIEEHKRKENKLKREIQEGQQEVRRNKIQQKKQEEELQAMSTAQIGWQMQRRKHLDQITSLQDQLSRKDYEFTKLNKEIEKWKSRAQEKDDLRLGKKSELKQEIEKLENELIRKQKKLFQQTEQAKLLRTRLELLQKQNKRIIEQKNQSYGQKLKYYVEEMGNIKKLLDEYQIQNSRLKVQNNELYEQYQMMRISLDKMQLKNDENTDREDDLLNQLQSYVNEVNVLKERLHNANEQVDRIQFAFNNLKKQNDEEKTQHKKNLEKLENSQRNLERTLVQVKELRIKQSQYETNYEINNKIGQRYRALERKKAELDEEHKKLKNDYQNAINTYAFRREDLQKAVNEARQHQRRLKSEEIQRIQQDCNKTIASKTQRLEEQILQIYNENSRLRAEMQVLLQENGRQKGRLTQLQIVCARIDSLQTENQQSRNALQELREELRKKNERINKFEVSIEGLNSENNIKDRQLNAMKNRAKQLESSIDKLNQEIKSRRKAQRQLQDALIRATEKKQKEKGEQQILNYQRETQMIQQYESRISSLEAELQRAKEKEAKAIEENANKMKKLEQKMDEMEQALKQKEKAIESHYQGELKELENSLMRLSQELQEKMIRNEQLNEAVLILEDENKALLKEIETLRYQIEEDKSIFQSQLLKLKAKLKQSEAAYSSNLKSLEEELMRATQTKGNNASNSRVKTNEAEQRIFKRYEQKLKNKDKKIEELKENIYTLEETILKLKKKDTVYEASVTQIEKLKIIISDFEKQKKNLQTQYGEELNLNIQLVRQLRKEILELKQKEEKARFWAEQKTLQFESVSCELKTIKQLYHDLQKDLQKRKNNLAMQLQQQSTMQNEFRLQQNKIIDLEEKLLQAHKSIKEFELQLKKKNNQLKRQTETNEQLKLSEKQMKAELSSLTTQITHLKKQVTQVENSYQSAKNQLKLSKIEVIKLRKSQQDLKQLCATKDSITSEMKRGREEIMMQYTEFKEAAHKYLLLNERSKEEIGCGLEQVIEKYAILTEEREMEYNQLVQEIQELKFLNQRKYMDYDQIKKMNFELQLKVEQYQSLNDQLQTLRKICDKLEQEKKNSIFRQQVLRMQIQNLAHTSPSELRSRIQTILAAQAVPSFGNFSFY